MRRLLSVLLYVGNRVNVTIILSNTALLGRGNDIRISKVGKSLASNPAFRHQARSSSAMDGNSRSAFFPRFPPPFSPYLKSFLISFLLPSRM